MSVAAGVALTPLGDADHARIFAIRRIDTNMLIGSCQLHSIDWVHRHAELRIRIGDAGSRGRGFGTEATRLLVNHAFADLNLHRVYVHAFADSTEALRCYEKAGFVREAVLKEAALVNGRRVDVIQMAVVSA